MSKWPYYVFFTVGLPLIEALILQNWALPSRLLIVILTCSIPNLIVMHTDASERRGEREK